MYREESNSEKKYFFAFREGLEKGFTHFFNAYYPALSFYAFRLTNEQAEAEDIVQECFLKLWNRRTEFKSTSHIKSFLYAVVRNACIDSIRHERYAISHEQRMQYLQNSIEENVLHDIVRAEVLNDVYMAIEKLPQECRKIFKMIYIEGKSYQEIASELKLSESTIRNQKAKGLLILKNLGLSYVFLPAIFF